MSGNVTCFVIMPIGDQSYGKVCISASELRSKYDDLIREAFERACPNAQITRADDISDPGVVSTDIITHIMHSYFVIADVTYPNPNVFYELGLRHAVKPGTVIVREKGAESLPFDISHLRYIEYENTPTGLKDLSDRFESIVNRVVVRGASPDSHFLELAKLTSFEYPDFGRRKEPDTEGEWLYAVMKNPEAVQLVAEAGEEGGEFDLPRFMEIAQRDPSLLVQSVHLMKKLGGDDMFGAIKPERPKRSGRKSSTKKAAISKQAGRKPPPSRKKK